MAHFVRAVGGHFINLDFVALLVVDWRDTVGELRYQCLSADGSDFGVVTKGEIDCALIEQERARMGIERVAS